MTSANLSVTALHASYCAAMAIDLELTVSMERDWLSALQEGIQPDDLRLVICDRRKRIREGVRHKESLYLRNLIGNDERIADLLNEAAVLRSLMRVPTVDEGKAEVMKATGRPVQSTPDNCRKMSDVFEAMRKAAQ